MLRNWIIIIAALMGIVGFSPLGYSAQASSMTLLDNRFRVDPSIKQITFVIYRKQNSQSVILVRPDGHKYHSQRHPDNVRWYQESAMDIVSIDDPMPGPWQAIGKVSSKNKIKLISHLELTTDRLPNRLFQGETIKFNARLTSNGQPLVLRDFLERVKLKVTFTKYVENEEQLIKEAKPLAIEMGEFADDGKDLDEVAGDGRFTVALPITSEPGKYRVRVTSGNGVFLRAQEQQVLVYPRPLDTTFIQSREAGSPNRVVISGEQGMILPGSIAGHIKHIAPTGEEVLVQATAEEKQNKIELNIPYNGALGLYSWEGKAFATEMGSQRPLTFPILPHSYSVAAEVDIAETRRLQEEQRIKRQKELEELKILQMREEERTRNFIIIVVGNIVVLLLGLIIWFVRRKLKAAKEAIPEMQLEMPKK